MRTMPEHHSIKSFPHGSALTANNYKLECTEGSGARERRDSSQNADDHKMRPNGGAVEDEQILSVIPF
jgi:hypothetical protein